MSKREKIEGSIEKEKIGRDQSHREREGEDSFILGFSFISI